MPQSAQDVVADIQAQGSLYTNDQRLEAIAHFAVTGNVTRTSQLCGIPRSTINDWKVNADWWVDAVSKVRQEKQEEIDANLSRILSKSTEKLEERIDVGDQYITKDGDTAYKAVSARDLATVTGIMFDKRQIMRNLPTSIKAESTDARLNTLAEKVRELQAGQFVIEQDSEEKE